MRYLLLTICLLGLAISDNTTVHENEEITNTGISLEVDTEEQIVNWGDWSPWSKWSSCSRSCDGGIAHQQRRCRRKPCRGRIRGTRYKLCNTQPCKDPTDFRAEQCAAFDNVPYSNQLLKWYPHYDPTRLCALICRGDQTQNGEVERDKPGKLRDDTVLTDVDDNFDLETDDTIVVELASKVEDGTRCRPGSLDVCIGGECMKVSCDLRIGGSKRTDACGICGGDGSSCQPKYYWSLEPISMCSKSCSGGFKMVRPVCKIQGPEEETVADSYCDPDKKPDKSLLQCNTHPCPTKWTTGEWSECSASCGGGLRTRSVFCLEEVSNETSTKLPDHKCSGAHKPRHQETCNTISCPMWEADEWSECTVSCGSGIRTRTVQCRDGKGRLSLDCDPLEQPYSQQECRTEVPCSSFGEDLSQPLMQRYPPPPAPEKLIGQPVPSDSTFIAEEWSPCSVTCGEGVRRREVHCKIFLEFSRTVAKLPDRQCSGPKPVETERCKLEPCSSIGNSLSYRMDTAGDSGYAESSLTDSYRSSGGSYESGVKVAPGDPGVTSYSWKELGYTHCSVTCLGGVQELIISCVKDSDGKGVTPYLCTPETRPESRIRTCNDHPCPPRWNYSEFAPCMSPCGLGIQTREVTCIHEVTRGGENTVIVPNHMCLQPPPPDRQYCNVLDCPVQWHIGDYAKCTKSCGGGTKTRRVECEQVMAQGHKQKRPESACPSPKPANTKPCNTRPCHEMEQPIIMSRNVTSSQPEPNKKVDLRIGGTAMVFYGTALVKIRCPVKKFDKSQIIWTKDHIELRKSKKYKMNKKGALRIMDITYADSGIYACIAGESQAETHLLVKVKPGDYMSSEEVLRIGKTVHQDVNIDSAPSNSGENLHTDHAGPTYGGSSFAFGSEDLSHEARPEGPVTTKPTKKPRPKKQKPKPTEPEATMIHEGYSVTSVHKPGYQESVESQATSSGSRLAPHLSHLISNLKGGTTAGRGHRMAPSFLPEDLRKDNSPTTRTLYDSKMGPRYDQARSDFGILHRDTAIPDEEFGPDEERIFIDDDPYDLDETIFALQHEQDFQSTPGIAAERRKQILPTKSAIDYIEESLRNTKRHEQESKDFFELQREVTPIETAEEPESRKNANQKTKAHHVAEPESRKKGAAFSGDYGKETLPTNISEDFALMKPDRRSKGFDSRSSYDGKRLEDHEKNFSNKPLESLSERGTTERPETGIDSKFDVQSSSDENLEESLKEVAVTNDNIIIQTDTETDSISADQNSGTNESGVKEKVDSRDVQSLKALERAADGNLKSTPQGTIEDSGILDESTEKPGETVKEVLHPEGVRKSFGLTQTWEVLTSTAFENSDTDDESTLGPIVILGKGTAKDLKFEWAITEWSKCSQTCGGGGFQMRGAQCTVRATKPISNSTRVSPKSVVGATLCEDAGYPTPQKVRHCGSGTCPQWHTGEWTSCENSRCFNWKTAMQRRDVSCRLVMQTENGSQNVTILDTNKCDDGIRPPQRQECYNDACKGVWRVGVWSECTASCEEDGIKYRILQCVWFGTKKPARNACRDIPRPSVMKTCKGPPCPQSPQECKDLSQFCGRVKAMNMCRVPLYQKQCCQSCH